MAVETINFKTPEEELGFRSEEADFDIEPERQKDFEYRPQGVWEKQDFKSGKFQEAVVESRSKLADRISQATTLEEIYAAVGPVTKANVENFMDFFRQKKDGLLISVLTKQKGQDNNLLTALLEAVPENHGLRQKVKDLAEREWHQYFQENQKDLLRNAIFSASSLDALYAVLEHFKSGGQSKKIFADNQEYEPEQVINQIKRVDSSFSRFSQQEDFLALSTQQIDQQLSYLLGKAVPGHAELVTENSPADVLIFNKAKQLLLEKIKEQRLEKKVAETTQSSWRRLTKGIGRFFRRS